MKKKSFFSVSFDLILKEASLPFDLYVNSSAHSDRERFVKIFPEGDILETKDLIELKGKYFQLYIPEDQRNKYLKSISSLDKYP